MNERSVGAGFLGALLISLVLPAGAGAENIPYREGFESAGPGGWRFAGAWHEVTFPQIVRVDADLRGGIVTLPDDGFWPAAWTGNGCLVATDESTGVYVAPRNPADTLAGSGGISLAARTDTAETPFFSAGPAQRVRLTFRTWWEVESIRPDSADRMIVEFTNDSGATWQFLDVFVDSARAASIPGGGSNPRPLTSSGYAVPAVWERRSYSAPTGANGEMAFRFVFDTVDSLRNGFRGWFLDDLSISCDSLYAPYGLTASDTLCDGVSLAWSDSSTAGLFFFSVGRSPVDSVRVDTVVTGLGTTAYTDTSALPGVRYRYTVWGVSPCGPSEPSAADTGSVPATPVAPTGFSATDSLCDRVSLAWTDLSGGEQGYLVFRNDTLVARLDADAEAYEDTDLAPGASPLYRVGAFNWCDTLFAGSDTGRVRPDPPDPLSVDATDDLCGEIRVTWQTTDGEYDSWVVFRDGDSLGAVPRGDAPLVRDTLAPAASSFVYTVRGRSECGYSAGSVSDEGFRIGVPPSPESCAATDDRCAEVVITWSPGAESGRVDSYFVYRDDEIIGFRTAADSPVWRDSTGLSEEWYRYRVVAWNPCDTSAAACADSGRRGAVPPTPSGVIATNGLCDRVEIAWNAVTGPFTEYVVYRDGDSIGAVSIDSLPAFVDAGIDSMRIASYTVRTGSECGISEAAAPDGGMRVGLPPAPSGCAATDDLCGRVVLTWSAPTAPGDVDRYVVYRGADSVGTTTATNFLDATAAPNTAHLYRVESRNECGASVGACEDSGMIVTAPGPVASFTASKNRCDTVRLDWEAPATGGPVWFYRVNWSTNTGSPETVEADLRVFLHQSPGAPEVVYDIRAVNCEESEAVVDTGRLFTDPPPAPDSCAATRVGCATIRLSWSASPGATLGYLVFREGGGLIDSVGPGITETADGGVSGGVDHEWRVFAVNSCGRSAEACTALARIPGPLGPAPAGACAATTNRCDGIRITWTWTHPDIEWFRIRRVSDGALLDSVPAGVSAYLDPSPPFGATVSYSVEAGNACFVSTSVCTATGSRPALPSAPQQCSATESLCDKIRVAWYWPSEYINENILGFRVYRQRSDQPSAPLDTFTIGPRIGAVTIDDETAVAGVSYFYRVVAYNACGETSGGCQSTGSATSVPSAPVLRSPADGATNQTVPLRLRWNRRTRATEYRVRIARDSSFTDVVVDAVTTDTFYVLAEVDSIGDFFWRVSGISGCGEGPASGARRFAIGFVPGLELMSGSTTLPFGNGSDSIFADSILVLQNLWFNPIAWSIGDTLSWVTVEPAAGHLAPGETESVTVSIAPHRCGTAVAGSLFVVSDPLPPGKEPIPLSVSLDPERRPLGDVNWDCRLDVEDGARIIDALLGETLSPSDSAGADGNGDGRINVADVVFIGGLLTASPPEEEPVVEGAVEIDFAPGGEGILRLRTGFGIRAARLVADLAGAAGTDVGPADGSGGMVKFEEGRAAVFWFGLEPEGAAEAPLLRIGNRDGVVTPRWIEVAGAGGERIRMALGGTDLAAAPLPARVVIEGVVPNPFNPRTAVRFALPSEGWVTVRVHDVRGARVRTVREGVMPPGRHEAVWDGRSDGGREAASGVYFVRVETAEGAATARMVLIR